MLDVLREEKKYEMTLPEMEYLKCKLSCVLHGDIYNGTKPYTVRSLYFDSADENDFFEKEAGMSERKKIRLRIYNTSDNMAKLELKAKSGAMQRKQSLNLTRTAAIKMCRGDYSGLLEYEDDLAGQLYRLMTMELYRPKCMVEYDRVAFSAPENNTRITFDSGVRSNEADFRIFYDELQMYPVMAKDRGVLEIKYNRFLLSYIKDCLECVNGVETSVSKYMLARGILFGGE